MIDYPDGFKAIQGSTLKTYRPWRGGVCAFLLMALSFVGGVLADRNCPYVHGAFDGDPALHQHAPKCKCRCRDCDCQFGPPCCGECK